MIGQRLASLLSIKCRQDTIDLGIRNPSWIQSFWIGVPRTLIRAPETLYTCLAVMVKVFAVCVFLFIVGMLGAIALVLWHFLAIPIAGVMGLAMDSEETPVEEPVE